MNTSQPIRTLLVFLAVTLNTVVVTVPDIPTWASGIIVAIVTGAAAVGIVPPSFQTQRTESGSIHALKRGNRIN